MDRHSSSAAACRRSSLRAARFHATVHGSDRSALHRSSNYPSPTSKTAIDTILDAHLAVTAAGYVAVDLYDGCFLYDFHARRLRLIDLDEYPKIDELGYRAHADHPRA
ncbi:hypothetical protein [Micromonospora sp. NPDC050276]|uniref:hypothetical protein n=1 Tax=Micromonospora sp. NPDC050276 TaxID=3364278 RepID=UPI0037A0796F